MPEHISYGKKAKVSELLAYAAIYRSHLWDKDTLRTSPAEVAELTGLSPSTAYRALNALIKRGLVAESAEGYSAVLPPDKLYSQACASFEIPSWLAVQHSDLSPSALVVLAIYHDLATKGSWGFAKVGDSYISSVTGIPERTAREAVKTLSDAGLILPYCDGKGRRIGWSSGTACQLDVVKTAAPVSSIVKMASAKANTNVKTAETDVKTAIEPIGEPKVEQLTSPNKTENTNLAGDKEKSAPTSSDDDTTSKPLPVDEAGKKTVEPAKTPAASNVTRFPKVKAGPHQALPSPNAELAAVLEHVPADKHPKTALDINDCNKQIANLLAAGITCDEIIGTWKHYAAAVQRKNPAPGGGVREGWQRYLQALRAWLRFSFGAEHESFCRAQAERHAKEAAMREAAAAEVRSAEAEKAMKETLAAALAGDAELARLDAEAEAIRAKLRGGLTFDKTAPGYELSAQLFELINLKAAREQEIQAALCR